MESLKDEILFESYSNSISTRACIFALRDILLQTEEQKALYKSKQIEYMDKFLIEFAKDFNVQNPEKFLEGLLKENQQ
ncbi:MAG: hypothetical protein ACOYMD_14860 [Paludibacter sp.]